MSTYNIEFTDVLTNGNFGIPAGRVNGPKARSIYSIQLSTGEMEIEDVYSTELHLYGEGALGYGELIDENFLHLLENFSCPEDVYPIQQIISVERKIILDGNKVSSFPPGESIEVVKNVPAATNGQFTVAQSTFINDTTHIIVEELIDEPTTVGCVGHTGYLYNSPDPTFVRKPVTGQMWHNSTTNTMWFFSKTNNAWRKVGGVFVGDGSIPPTQNPSPGDLWYDTSEEQLKVWNGSAWVSVSEKYLLKNGDTMTGYIELVTDPTFANANLDDYGTAQDGSGAAAPAAPNSIAVPKYILVNEINSLRSSVTGNLYSDPPTGKINRAGYDRKLDVLEYRSTVGQQSYPRVHFTATNDRIDQVSFGVKTTSEFQIQYQTIEAHNNLRLWNTTLSKDVNLYAGNTTLSGQLDMMGNKIINLPDATADTDAINFRTMKNFIGVTGPGDVFTFGGQLTRMLFCSTLPPGWRLVNVNDKVVIISNKTDGMNAFDTNRASVNSVYNRTNPDTWGVQTTAAGAHSHSMGGPSAIQSMGISEAYGRVATKNHSHSVNSVGNHAHSVSNTWRPPYVRFVIGERT